MQHNRFTLLHTWIHAYMKELGGLGADEVKTDRTWCEEVKLLCETSETLKYAKINYDK